MPGKHSTPMAPPSARPGRLDALYAAGAVALCAAAVAAMAWTRPATTALQVGYQQTGRLEYSAPTPATSLYAGATVSTGQPVYTNAVSDLTVTYDYQFASTASPDVSGTEQLVASIDNGQGITRTFALQPAPVSFRGPGFHASATLHLADIQAAAGAFEQLASVDGAASYSVSISPDVVLDGGIAGQHLRASFDQPALFSYRPSSSASTGALSPIQSKPTGQGSTGTNGGATAPSPTASAVGTPITITQRGSVSRPGGQAAKLFFGLPVSRARIGAPALLVAALLVLVLLGRRVLGEATDEDETRRIAFRYGSTLVEVDALPLAPGTTVVVSSFEGLLKVARRIECPVLHHRDRLDAYAVVDGVTVYRYVATRKGDLGTAVRPVDAERRGPSLGITTNGHHPVLDRS